MRASVTVSARKDALQHPAAEAILRESVAALRVTLGERSWQLPRAMGLPGTSQTGQAKCEEAEPLLLDAYERTRNSPDAPAGELEQGRTRLVEL